MLLILLCLDVLGALHVSLLAWILLPLGLCHHLSQLVVFIVNEVLLEGAELLLGLICLLLKASHWARTKGAIYVHFSHDLSLQIPLFMIGLLVWEEVLRCGWTLCP